jgi:hypothetical protein
MKEISIEKIDKIYKELESLQNIAIQDLLISDDMNKNFERTNTILKWTSYYTKWKKISNSINTEYKKIRNTKYFSIKDGFGYTYTDKEINLKVDADDIMISYQNLIDAIELVLMFIQKIQGLLDSQRYDIKDKLTYLMWVNGEDF